MTPKQLDRCDKKGHHLCLCVFWEIVVFFLKKNKPFNQVHVDAYVHPGLLNCSISPDLLRQMSVYLISCIKSWTGELLSPNEIILFAEEASLWWI